MFLRLKSVEHLVHVVRASLAIRARQGQPFHQDTIYSEGVAEDAVTILLNLKLSFPFRKVKEICPTFKSKSFMKNHVFSP